MKKLSFLALFALLSTVGFAQDYQILSQDSGLTIHHPNCRVWVGDIGSVYKSMITPKMEEVLKAKGYRFNYYSIHGGLGKQAIVKKNDLVLNISRIHGIGNKKWNWQYKGKLYIKNEDSIVVYGTTEGDLTALENIPEYKSQNFKKRPINFGEQYDDRRVDYSSKAIKAQLSLAKQIPSCATSKSGYPADKNFDLEIRDYELASCSKMYSDEIKRLDKEPNDKAQRLISLGGIWTMSIGVLVPPLAWVGGGVLILNNARGFLGLTKGAKKRKLRDGISLMDAIRECEQLRSQDKTCDSIKYILLDNLSKKSSRSISRLIDRVGFEFLSERMANSIVINKSCSNTEIATKDMYPKKIIKQTKRNL